MADHSAEATNSGFVLKDSTYDQLRVLVEKVFPGIAALYAAFAAIWGWGYAVQVSGSFAALAVFGGLLLTLARKGYVPATTNGPPAAYNGEVVQDVNETGAPVLRLQLKPEATDSIMSGNDLLIKGYDPAS